MSADAARTVDSMDALRRELRQFTGSEVLYRHWSGMRFTEGVKYLAEHARLWWFLDVVASHQARALEDHYLREFQLWELRITEEGALAVCLRDSDDAAFHQKLGTVDSALDYVRLYVENHTILLPSEH